jgi:hypothetical protein
MPTDCHLSGMVNFRRRPGRPHKTTPREDRLISRRARQRPFSTVGALRGNLAFGGHICYQITIKKVQVQLTVKEKTTPDSYTQPPKSVVPKMWLSWNEVFRWRQTLHDRMHNGGFSHRRVATSGLTIPSLYDWCRVFVKWGMLLTVHVQVYLRKRRR